MIELIFLTFFVFFIFWFGDFYLTLITIKHVGYGIEINPLLKIIFKYRGKFIYIFKLIEISVFLYLIYIITKFQGVMSFRILLTFILFYSLLVVNNSNIYFKATRKESIFFKLLFLIVTISLLSFIFLSYIIYSDLQASYFALSESNHKYESLYEICKQNNSSNTNLSKEFEETLNEVNFSVRK